MSGQNYLDILKEHMEKIGKQLDGLWNRKTVEPDMLIHQIQEMEQEAADMGIDFPFSEVTSLFQMNIYEKILLCNLLTLQGRGMPGLERQQALELMQIFGMEQSLEELSPCFLLNDTKISLSAVATSYLMGRFPGLPGGARLHVPEISPMYQKEARLSYGRQVVSACFAGQGTGQAAEEESEPVALVISGQPGSGRHFLAEQLAASFQMSVIRIAAVKREYTTREVNELLLCANLFQAWLVLDIEDTVPENFLLELSSCLPFLILITGEKRQIVEETGWLQVLQRLELPDADTRQQIIREQLALWEPQLSESVKASILAKQLPLGSYLRFVKNIATELKAGTFQPDKNVYQTNSLQLKLLPADRRFEELKLPQTQLEQLEKICDMAAARSSVLKKWGFERKFRYGMGFSILFYGAPGTGKTMAAQVLANTLSMPLLRVELTQLISKYIGETQKNIEKIFEEAEKSGCILLFDEADAIFAKRNEVSDAQDRYSNAETACLLQGMEQYSGISILATNLLQNFDEAFRRRITYMLHFPLPDAELQKELWESIFPAEAEIEQEVDPLTLASCFQLSGAGIKNAALHAAYLAMAKNSKIGMFHILDGIRNEYGKQGRQFNEQQEELAKLHRKKEKEGV